MRKIFDNFSRVLCAQLLCAGLVFAGCTEGPLDNNQNTDQSENQNGNQNGNDATSDPVTISIENITSTTVTFKGKINVAESDKAQIEVGVVYSLEEGEVANGQGAKLAASEIASDNTFSLELNNLHSGATYYYCSYVKQGNTDVYGEVKQFTTTAPTPPIGYTNLSVTGTANCYIVSQGGNYCFLVAKGNQSAEFLHLTNSVSVLWESFGTDVTPNVGDLIKSVSYKEGYIAFQTAETFKEGNAVIAAMDAKGTILWSWHIWLTDQPKGQFYNNSAGTMMDRNLGATSATMGDIGALGLLYQWGRKDPFLGSSSVSSRVGTAAKSTITWPSPVPAKDWLSNAINGTVSYVIANPTTFVAGNSSGSGFDWHFSSRDNTLWTTSDQPKSIYDPCPAGWRVPDGGDIGIWSRALGTSSIVEVSGNYSDDCGVNFSGVFGPASTIWYPASGYLKSTGDLEVSCSNEDVGWYGYYWSASTTEDNSAYCIRIWAGSGPDIDPDYYDGRYQGQSVRCAKE